MTYEEHVSKFIEQYKDVFNERQTRLVYSLAYDQGHAYGFDEVESCFDTLADAFILFKEAQ
jgi:hypothetical protein